MEPRINHLVARETYQVIVSKSCMVELVEKVKKNMILYIIVGDKDGPFRVRSKSIKCRCGKSL